MISDYPHQLISLSFIKDLPLYHTEKPYFVVIEEGEGKAPSTDTNLELAPVRGIPLQDVRGRESEFTLECNGFKYLKHKTHASADDEEDNWVAYSQEMARLIQEECGAEKVICYDYRVGHERRVDELDKVLMRRRYATMGQRRAKRSFRARDPSKLHR